MIKRIAIAVALVALALSGGVRAEDAYYHLLLEDLQLTEGTLPAVEEVSSNRWWNHRSNPAHVVLDGEGEAYLLYRFNARGVRSGARVGLQRELAVRLPAAREVTGQLILPQSDDSERHNKVRFRISADKADPDARDPFFELKIDHYENLLAQEYPGAAWFRHQLRSARQQCGQDSDASPRRQASTRRNRTTELAETFALFSGGRAMSENLQLDRVLQPADEGGELVSLASIEGITVREIDWEPLVEGLEPELDPLASKIPVDQHAVFFPSFNAAVAMSDEIRAQGATILQLAEPRSTSARTFERYQQQMCLTISAVARLVGPRIVQSVAVTGSDPYFRTGTDVAVLFQTKRPDSLEKLLLTQVSLSVAEHPEAESVQGDIRGWRYSGARSPDRAISCYIAKTEDLVVVTNSLFQLQQLSRVTSGKNSALASLPEFTFFRQRYQRDAAHETAFLFLSDATIRRWCGPKWRIATSRRLRDAAVLAELQASQLDRLVQDQVTTGPLYSDLPVRRESELTLTPEGVQGTSIGSLAFMTPISEMDVARVSKAEAEAYSGWRDRYQSNWQWAFDPIGLRFGVHEHQVSADLTVMPLIWGSDYRQAISYSRGAAFEPDAGDPHDSLAHVIVAINTDSEALRRQTNLLRMMTGAARLEPLSWLGNNASVYLDNDPFWQKLAEVPVDELDEFMEREGWRMPLAIRADVSSGMKLTLFLGAVRAFIEQASPGMLNWETLTYQEQPYVKITPTARAVGRSEPIRNLAVFYSASGKSLTLTLNEDVLKRAIRRDLAREKMEQDGQEPSVAERPWLGSSVGLQVEQRILQVLASLGREHYQRTMQRRAWSNLPILNEWRQRYPAKNPLTLHERFWNQRLLCPGGGEYVWNEQWQTMESTVYGCPPDPKQGPIAPPMLQSVKQGDFGLTFEEQGLRARVELKR